jgi:2,3-diketo-5-methylthio-1-phosphopentane phosphatase
LVDFDETAAEQNVAELLLERFGVGEWEELRDRFRQGRLTLQEYQERVFSQVQASPAEMGRYAAEHANLRPGFLDLLRYCNAHEIQVAIVTYGLDFYVDALLKSNEVADAAQVFAVGTQVLGSGLDFLYPYANPACVGWGNCKCRVLERFRIQGMGIIYVGDGRSDFCPAAKADAVFARGPLLEHCRERGIAHQGFEDFHVVLAAVENGLPLGPGPSLA